MTATTARSGSCPVVFSRWAGAGSSVWLLGPDNSLLGRFAVRPGTTLQRRRPKLLPDETTVGVRSQLPVGRQATVRCRYRVRLARPG